MSSSELAGSRSEPPFLEEPDPERAWSRFLEDCTGVIERATTRVAADEEERRNVVVEVLAKIRADWPGLVRRYRAGRRSQPGRFRPWLAVVARHLAIDVLRSFYGRPTVPRAVARLPHWKRELYRLLYREGLSTHEAWEALRAEGLFDRGLAELGLEARALEESLPHSARVAAASIRRPERGRGGEPEEDGSALDPAAPAGAAPARAVARETAHQGLRRILAELAPDERLLLRSYYLEGATADDVARLTGWSRHQVYGRVRTLLDRLRDAVRAEDLEPNDLEELMDFDWFTSLTETLGGVS